MTTHYRAATLDDVPALAAMNQALIRDEGHRNPMTLPQLQDRMAEWLRREYEAILFENNGSATGYALFRREPEYVYLRQLYVCPQPRRQGVGRAAFDWLRTHPWAGERRLRVEVLVGNAAAIAFWRAVGFRDYCLTLEMQLDPPN